VEIFHAVIFFGPEGSKKGNIFNEQIAKHYSLTDAR